jgi:hypothetical protein
MHVAGLDLFQRPVIYSVFNLAEDKAPETNRLHMIHQFETVRLLSFPLIPSLLFLLSMQCGMHLAQWL